MEALPHEKEVLEHLLVRPPLHSHFRPLGAFFLGINPQNRGRSITAVEEVFPQHKSADGLSSVGSLDRLLPKARAPVLD